MVEVNARMIDERKCDTETRDFSRLRSLLLSLGEFDLVNDGSDTGRGSLRQLKDSLRPVETQTEHNMAIQRRERSTTVTDYQNRIS